MRYYKVKRERIPKKERVCGGVSVVMSPPESRNAKRARCGWDQVWGLAQSLHFENNNRKGTVIYTWKTATEWNMLQRLD
jgi:ribosomal protein S27AE